VPPWPALHQPRAPRQAPTSTSAQYAALSGWAHTADKVGRAWRCHALTGAAGASRRPAAVRNALQQHRQARRTCDATIRPMPSSICGTDTTCVWLPSPESTLERPTSVMPTCGALAPAGL